jgi:flagellar motor switch protein FliG
MEPAIARTQTLNEIVRQDSPAQSATSGLRKAAIIVALLGEDLAGELFKRLSEEEVQAISRELLQFQSITPEQAEEVLEEFHHLSLARSYLVRGGPDYAVKLLSKIFGEEQARKLLRQMVVSEEVAAGFEQLEECDPQQLSKLLLGEGSQTIALIIAHLNPPLAAKTLSLLPQEIQTDVTLRIVALRDIPQEVVRRISNVLNQKLSLLRSLSLKPVGGVHTVAEIMNHLERERGREILDGLSQTNPELALEIRNLMFTFDDLLLLDNLGIREILSRVDKKVLALALKGTSAELQERFYSQMSQRAAEMLREEMDFMGAVKVKDVNEAQQEIIEIVRALDEEGIISISGGGEDQYIT